MKTKEQLLYEIKGALHFEPGNSVIINGTVYSTPYDIEGIEVINTKATIHDLIVPGFYPYEIIINDKHYFCYEKDIAKEV